VRTIVSGLGKEGESAKAAKKGGEDSFLSNPPRKKRKNRLGEERKGQSLGSPLPARRGKGSSFWSRGGKRKPLPLIPSCNVEREKNKMHRFTISLLPTKKKSTTFYDFAWGGKTETV